MKAARTMVPHWMSIPPLVAGVALIVVGATGIGGRARPQPPLKRAAYAGFGVGITAQAATYLALIPQPVGLTIFLASIVGLLAYTSTDRRSGGPG